MTQACVAVASKSKIKIEAVRMAFERILSDFVYPVPFDSVSVHGFKTNSLINEQPYDVETVTGCWNRMEHLRKLVSGHEWKVSIENGVYIEGNSIVDKAIVLVQRPTGHFFWSTSEGVAFPRTDFLVAMNRGFETTTVGSVIAERTGCDPQDPHSFLTNGRLSRQQLLTDAVVSALETVIRL